jgi:hypothetical protein
MRRGAVAAAQDADVTAEKSREGAVAKTDEPANDCGRCGRPAAEHGLPVPPIVEGLASTVVVPTAECPGYEQPYGTQDNRALQRLGTLSRRIR